MMRHGSATRRTALVLLSGVLPLFARANSSDAAALLRRGGVVLMLRHAQTTPGVGDPPGFKLADCSSQRQLSDEGRAQARRIGEWFKREGLTPSRVRSSAWCRCIDTAMLAFGTHEPWPVIDSTFGEAATSAARAAAIDVALRAVPAGRFEVWVTHQVNVSGATGESLAMGEGVVAKPAATPTARPIVVARLAI